MEKVYHKEASIAIIKEAGKLVLYFLWSWLGKQEEITNHE